MLTETEVIDTYREYREALEASQAAYLALLRAEQELEGRIYVSYAAGEVVGRNEAEREAQAHMLHRELYQEVQKLRIAYTQAKHELALAQVDLDLINLRLGFIER